MEISAPAKINTFLKIVGKRENGYHDLQMIMVPVSLYDDLVLEDAPGDIEFFSDGLTDDGMVAEKNLCWRAASLLRETYHVKRGAKIYLKKRIPLGAGLGGGSSDAASVLIGLNKLWELNLPPERLAEIGVKLGADVAFFCFGVPAMVTGIGDRVEPLKKFPNLMILLINPGIHIATKDVYQTFDLLLTEKSSNVSFPQIFNHLGDVCSSLHNDLERVVLQSCPEIVRIKGFLRDCGAKGVLMSGSGSTVFGVFDGIEGVKRAADLGAETGWKCFPVHSMPTF